MVLLPSGGDRVEIADVGGDFGGDTSIGVDADQSARRRENVGISLHNIRVLFERARPPGRANAREFGDWCPPIATQRTACIGGAPGSARTAALHRPRDHSRAPRSTCVPRLPVVTRKRTAQSWRAQCRETVCTSEKISEGT